MSVSTPLNVFTHYFGGYAQDDWRINSKFTLTYGLRLEHEKGLSEKDNNFTVGFDPAMQSALSTIAIPADPVAGTPARTVTGGLMYAGVDGNKTYQGNAPAVKWSPRVGAVYAFNDRTVIRGGYGLYWAPFNYPIPSTSAQQLRAGRLQPEHDPHQQPQQPDHVRESVPEWHRSCRRATAAAR